MGKFGFFAVSVIAWEGLYTLFMHVLSPLTSWGHNSPETISTFWMHNHFLCHSLYWLFATFSCLVIQLFFLAHQRILCYGNDDPIYGKNTHKPVNLKYCCFKIQGIQMCWCRFALKPGYLRVYGYQIDEVRGKKLEDWMWRRELTMSAYCYSFRHQVSETYKIKIHSLLCI